jgi:hypothetical protein
MSEGSHTLIGGASHIERIRNVRLAGTSDVGEPSKPKIPMLRRGPDNAPVSVLPGQDEAEHAVRTERRRCREFGITNDVLYQLSYCGISRGWTRYSACAAAR